MTESDNNKIPGNLHIIDCSLKPQDFVGILEILAENKQISSRFKGVLEWNKEKQKTALYFSKKQTSGEKWINGNELMQEIIENSLPILPANVLDFLLEHPEVIPEEWKGQAVYFWGTLYLLTPLNPLCVRYLCWNNKKWDSGIEMIENGYFDAYHPAAIT